MSKTLSDKEYEKIGRMIEDVVVAGTTNTKRLLWYNFLKGIANGLGIFIAGTVVVAIVIWLLNLFNEVPLIGPFVQNIINSLQ